MPPLAPLSTETFLPPELREIAYTLDSEPDMRLLSPILYSLLLASLASSALCSGKVGGDAESGEQGVGKRSTFNIASTDAVEALEAFADQAQVPILYLVKQVQGVVTNEVRGEYTPRLALSRLVVGTPLMVTEDLDSGAYLVKRIAGASEPLVNQQTDKDLKMTNPKQKRSKLLRGLLAVTLAGANSLSAQTEAEQGEEDVFELSPFTVKANDNSGYRATSTLAGTRIKTDLKDLGAAISVITSEFMQDTSATDAATLLSYTSNTEVGGDQGNFSGAENVDDGRFFQTDARTNPQLNQRIRGLGAADLTRGYFLTDIAFDTYNTERVTVSRGPNSLLFGIGSPGGVINNGTKQAVQGNDFNEFKVRLDSHGSVRSEFDINRSIIDGRLAIRIAGLNDEAQYNQNPAWNHDKRIYGALEAVLFPNEGSSALGPTLFRLNGESGSSNGSPVEVIPPSVAYHGWFEPTPANIGQFTGADPSPQVVAPAEGGVWEFQATYNPFVTDQESSINTNSHPAIFRHIGITYEAANASAPSLSVGAGIEGSSGLITWNRNLDTVGSAGLAGTPGAVAAGLAADSPLNRIVEYHAVSPYGEGYAIGFAVPTLQNPEVFDYRNNVYSGGIDSAGREFNAVNLVLEQNMFGNNLGFELAYDKQHYESTQDFFFTGGDGTSSTGPYDIYVSIAEYLQNGQPNPNLGRAYTRVAKPTIGFNEIDRETLRFTAFGKVDFSKRDDVWRHLGRHQFTALYNDSTRETASETWRESWVSNDFDIASAVQGTTLSHPRRPVNVSVFTSENSLIGLASQDDVRLNQISISRPQPGDSYSVLYADTSSAGAPRSLETGEVVIERYLDGQGIGRTEIEATALAWQSYLLDKHIVGLLGYRQDDTKSFGSADEDEVGFAARDTDGRWRTDYTRLAAAPSLAEKGDTVTWSVVGRYPEVLLGNLPGDMDLQFHYAKSENFNPVGLRNNALGQSLGQPTGETVEYGLLASFAENKYTVKLNWFETELSNVSAAPNTDVAAHARAIINNYRSAQLDGIAFSDTLETVQGAPGAFPIQTYDAFYASVENALPETLREIVNFRQEDSDGDNVWDTIGWDPIQRLSSSQNRIAEGFEFELTAAPVSGLRLIANVSRQQTIQSDTARVMADVVEAYNTALQTSRAIELRADAAGTTQTRPIQELFLTQQVAPVRSAAALDNIVSNEQREWRFTGVANYDFQDGRFKGFSVGGAIRWEDEAATGYVFELEPETGVPVPDVTQPFFDDSLVGGDLWVGYKKRLADKIDWSVQLNIRNAFGNDDDIPVKTNPDGEVAVVRIPNPRTIYLTNSFRF